MLTIPSSFQDQDFVSENRFEVDLAQVGQGDWRAFRAVGLSVTELMEVASGWAGSFAGIERPWLCWHVDDDWSLVQQRLVASVGWTPVVGFDPRVGPPRRTVPEAVVIDFNGELQLPVLYSIFPVEFAFLFCDKIAFWHSDLLMRETLMQEAAGIFAELEDGQTAAVRGWAGLRASLSRKHKRYFELLGCTTRSASQDQFRKGCGWWRAHWAHPNQPRGGYVKKHLYWDNGAGIYDWHHYQKGDFRLLGNPRYHEGHFTKIGNPNYQRYREPDSGSDARRHMSVEIKQNFDLVQACKSLAIQAYLESPR